jgi:hypothetical protein
VPMKFVSQFAHPRIFISSHPLSAIIFPEEPENRLHKCHEPFNSSVIADGFSDCFIVEEDKGCPITAHAIRNFCDAEFARQNEAAPALVHRDALLRGLDNNASAGRKNEQVARQLDPLPSIPPLSVACSREARGAAVGWLAGQKRHRCWPF